MNSLAARVKELWQTKLQGFNLGFISATERDGAIVGDKFFIAFSLGRDGLDINYYRIPNDIAAPLEYGLPRFLFLKRLSSDQHPQKREFASDDEKQAAELSQFVDLLVKHCPDILRGEEAWMKDYEARWGKEVVPTMAHKRVREIHQRGLAQRATGTTVAR